MRIRLVSAAVVFVFALAACRDRVEPAGDSEPGAAAAVDAGTPPTPDLIFTIQAPLLGGGTAVVPMGSGEQPELEPASTLEITSNMPVRNYRVRVFDEIDRAMVSDDVAEDTAAGVRYQVAFPTPLKTGHKYTVVIDPQTGPNFTDAHGRTYAELRQTFRIAGEKERPKPAPKKKRRR